MNIFELGIKAFQHMDDIKRVIQLIPPTIDCYKAHPTVVADVQRAINSLKPIIDEYAKAEPTLVPLVTTIMNDFFPPPPQPQVPPAPPTRQLVTPTDGYNVKWLQQALVELKVVSKLDNDGDYGTRTKIAVKKYQQSLVDRHQPNWSQKDVDGWAGLKTCAAIYNDLSK